MTMTRPMPGHAKTLSTNTDPATTPGNESASNTTSGGSAFTIVRRGISRVLRQSDSASPATHVALLNASDWTNESIQADVRPLSFASGGWDGLATRYRDAGNNYYVRVDSAGLVSLRRKVAGVIVTLASAPAVVGTSFSDATVLATARS